MLQSVFLWYYCLSISDAVLLIAVFSAGYLVLRRYLGSRKLWRLGILLLFLAWLGVIAVATLTDRTPGTTPVQPQLIPFHSYRAVLAGENRELLRSNFMNVMLFFPAGLLACELLPKGWGQVKKVVLITVLFALISAGIEFCQYTFALGQPEIDDVLHNALGALAGAAICSIRIPAKKE